MAVRPCPRCGQPAAPEAAFCGACGAQLPTSRGPRHLSTGGLRARPVPLVLIVVIVVVAAVVVLGAVLALQFASLVGPTDHSWGAQLATKPGLPASATTNFPLGVTVQGSWTATGAGWVNFSILAAIELPLFNANATHGTFAFVSAGFNYTFQALSDAYENVSVEATYTTHGPTVP